MNKKRRNMETFNLSFLDVVCCGFGAVILLLVLTKIYEPSVIQESKKEVQSLIAALERQLFEMRGDSDILNSEMKVAEAQISEDKKKESKLIAELSELQGQFDASNSEYDFAGSELKKMQLALQTVTKEQKALKSKYDPQKNNAIGGIPVDSEYVVFVIDNSASMTTGNWKEVLQKVDEILQIYPSIKGIQVLNSIGDYLLGGSKRDFIRDSQSTRRNIMNGMVKWSCRSRMVNIGGATISSSGGCSCPFNGVKTAIQNLYKPSRKISLFIIGDDYACMLENSNVVLPVQSALDTISDINKSDKFGNRLVRIHGISIYNEFQVFNRKDFANFMRKIAENNGGTFITAY
jgi:hypothetical protein